MTKTLHGLSRPAASAGGIVRAAAGAVGRYWAAYTAWRIERLAIARLKAMNDRDLKDIGLVRSQIEIAVRGSSGRRPSASRMSTSDRATGHGLSPAFASRQP